MSSIPVAITIGDIRLAATFESNSTSETLLGRLPFALPMLDLYGHELVHRFAEPLPTTNLVTRAPRRGDIVYWSPRNAVAIFYGDGDEAFSDLQIGRVDAGIDLVNHPGDTTVTFERAAD
jgi:hypothetical protein